MAINGRFRVYNSIFIVKNNRIMEVYKIDGYGYEYRANLYYADGNGYTQISNKHLSEYKFSTIRSGMYAGRYIVN